MKQWARSWLRIISRQHEQEQEAKDRETHERVQRQRERIDQMVSDLEEYNRVMKQ